MDRYHTIGIMSGTSLDGLDICYCEFELDMKKKWRFKIVSSETKNYPRDLEEKLKKGKSLSGWELVMLNNEFGDYIGQSINGFISKNKIDKNNIDLIASHGHTIFHQPQNRLTLQIGNGANIAAITGLTTITDFRSVDIALNGQGAPLVPIGDSILFPEFHYCINLGGIANVSFNKEHKRVAFDICPVNIVLNYLASQLGQPYDKDGELAKTGNLQHDLLDKLNSLDYYKNEYPKSLGIEWVEREILSIINGSKAVIEDKLRTFVEHIAVQISNSLNESGKKVLFTGGGTRNSFLMRRITAITKKNCVIPALELIDYKEAVVFGFLGVLRYRNENNTLKSSTGASKDSIGGCIYKAVP